MGPGSAGVAERGWLLCDLDPEYFQVPDAEGLADSRDSQVISWLWAKIQPPGSNAAAQLTREHGWTRLEVASLIVDRSTGGAGRDGASRHPRNASPLRDRWTVVAAICSRTRWASLHFITSRRG